MFHEIDKSIFTIILYYEKEEEEEGKPKFRFRSTNIVSWPSASIILFGEQGTWWIFVSPTPMFVKLTHLISLGSVTIATYIRLPCLVKIRITSVVISNKGSTAIPHSVPVTDVTEFNDQVKFSPIMYLMRCPRRRVFSAYRQPIF